MSMLRAFMALSLFLLMREPSTAAQMTANEVVQDCWAKMKDPSLSLQHRRDLAAGMYTLVSTGNALDYTRERRPQSLPQNISGRRILVKTPDISLTAVQVMGFSRTIVANNDQVLRYMCIATAAVVMGVDTDNILEIASNLSVMRPWQGHLGLFSNMTRAIAGIINRGSHETKLDAHFHGLNFNIEGKSADFLAFVKHTATQVASGTAPPVSDDSLRTAGIRVALIQADDNQRDELKRQRSAVSVPVVATNTALPAASDEGKLKIDLSTQICATPILLRLRDFEPSKAAAFYKVFDFAANQMPSNTDITREIAILSGKVMLSYTLEYGLDRAAPGVFDYSDFLNMLIVGKFNDFAAFEAFRKPEDPKDKAFAYANKKRIAKAKFDRDELYGSLQHLITLKMLIDMIFDEYRHAEELEFHKRALAAWQRGTDYVAANPDSNKVIYDDEMSRIDSQHRSNASGEKPVAPLNKSQTYTKRNEELRIKNKRLSLADMYKAIGGFEKDAQTWMIDHGGLLGNPGEPNLVMYLERLF
jgi:hypothetical protein